MVKDFNDSLGNTGDRRTGPLYYSAPLVAAGDVTSCQRIVKHDATIFFFPYSPARIQ